MSRADISDGKNKKLQKNAILFLVIILIVFIVGSISYFLKDEINREQSDSETYSWDSDPNRLNMAESVYNITLIVDFNNGTTLKFLNISLSDHYTTVFDVLMRYCSIKYKVYYLDGSSASFYVYEINGVKEDKNNNRYWLYYVNDNYAMVACNAYQLQNNDVVLWQYSSALS